MLVSNAETAFARLDREWELSTQEAALSETEAALEHTHRREVVLRDVLGALVDADTRSDIEHGRGCLVSKGTRTANPVEARTDVETCSCCGSKVETDQWHPVIADDDGNGFRIHAFCDERCRKRWGQ